MTSLLTWLCIIGSSIGMNADAERGLIQQAKLIAADGGGGDFFGYSVALSLDGNTAIAGVYDADVGGHANQGAAYVFTRSGATWSQQAKLTAADGDTDDQFGSSVALSSDGNTVIAGAEATVGGNANQGAVYVFTRSGSSWSQQAKLTAAEGAAYDLFGSSVALSSDGDIAIAGAYNVEVGGNTHQGAAYVFTRSGSSWNQQAELTAADGAAYDSFGYSVALSLDGNAAIAGAYDAHVGGHANQGAAYVFTRSGSSWSQQAKLTAADGAAEDLFGCSVALNSDGNTAIAGAEHADVGGNANQGAAYVFTRSDSSWSQQAKLTASDGGARGDDFGGSVALSSDGNTAIAGARYAYVGGNANQGAAYVFTRSGSFWSQQAKLIASDGGANDSFGYSVALSSDGNTAIAGALEATVGGNANQGAAYVFYNDVIPTVGPTIKANGATGTVTVNYPETVSITVEMNADNYAGTPVDWWVIAIAGSSWYYLNNSFQWIPENNLLNWHPVYQGRLFNTSLTVLNSFQLPRGTYYFWFAVDYPMEGILNLNGTILYDMVTVVVQ